jgi:hypothetical protein
MQAVLDGKTLITYQTTTDNQTSTMTFEDAMAFVGGEVAMAA